jgi:hypothetical protein
MVYAASINADLPLVSGDFYIACSTSPSMIYVPAIIKVLNAAVFFFNFKLVTSISLTSWSLTSPYHTSLLIVYLRTVYP